MIEGYRERINELRAAAEQDEDPVNAASLHEFWKFILKVNLRRGNLVLVDNGNLRVTWKDEHGARLSMQFLGDGHGAIRNHRTLDANA